MILLSIFWEFFKTGLFSLGGGMATIPFLLNISQRTNWYTTAELADMIAIGESTPGPIGINIATFVGYRINGFIGALISTFGLVFPSFVIIILIAKLLDKFNERPFVKLTFVNLRALVIGLIGYAIYKFGLIAFDVTNGLNFIAFIFYFFCLILLIIFKKLHPLLIILAGAIFGILFL